MPLLDDDLRSRLPPMHAQEAENDRHVFARWFLPGMYWAWYPMEGEATDDDYQFFGFVLGHESEFGNFLLSELEALRSPTGARVERDLTFTEGRLTDVVPAPDV